MLPQFLPALITLRSVLMIGGLAFLTGTYAGGKAVWWIWDVANTRAEVQTHRENQRRIAEVLRVNDKLNLEDAEAERINQEILNAIVTSQTWKSVVTPAAKCDPDPVCIAASSMRNIKRFQ